VNDAPVNTLPVGFAATEDAILTLSGISLGDIDNAALATVILNVTSGNLTLNTAVAGGATAGQAAGNGTGTITISGASITAINATRAHATGLQLAPVDDNNIAANFTLTADDGALTDIDIRSITFTPVNDTPVIGTAIMEGDGILDTDGWSWTAPAGSFTDIDADALLNAAPQTLTYSAFLDGGTPLPAWLVFDPVTQSFNVTAGTGVIGLYYISLRATDNLGTYAEQHFHLGIGVDGLSVTAGDDVLIGTPAADSIMGFGGND